MSQTIQELYDLSGKTAFITGGTRGLGLQMAEGLVEAGARVALASVDPEKNRAAVERRIASLDGQSIMIPLDVTDRAQTEAAVQKTLDHFGAIDICITSAGINEGHPLAPGGLETFRQIMEVNTTGTYLTCAAVAETMRQQRSGSIITISSIYGLCGLDKSLYVTDRDEAFAFPAYHASKGAVVNLTRDMAAHLGRFGVRANCLCPATFVSDQNWHILQGDTLDKINERTPLRRTGGDDDLKGVAVFLASEASQYITGAILPVDGGWTAW